MCREIGGSRKGSTEKGGPAPERQTSQTSAFICGLSGVLKELCPCTTGEGLPVLKATEGQWRKAGSCCTVHPHCAALTSSWVLSHLAHTVLMAHDKCQQIQSHKPLVLCSSRMGDFPGHWMRSHHGSTIQCNSFEHCQALHAAWSACPGLALGRGVGGLV